MSTKIARTYELLDAKSENGIISGLGNTKFEVDNYGDIVIGYIGLDKLVTDGFLADSHGLDSGNGEMGAYTFKGTAGVITSARESERGLEASYEFDPSPSSQELRMKAEFRIDKKKKVFHSIGFKPVEPKIIYRSQYKTLLPNYIPANRLDAVLSQVEDFDKVRVLKADVKELSLTPRPVNTGSVAEDYKAMKEIEINETEFKGEYLGEEITDQLALSAIDTAYYRMRNCLYNICIPSWSDDAAENEDEETQNVNDCIDEFCELAKGIFAKMQELEIENGGLDEEQIAEQKSLIEKGIIEFKAQWTRAYIDSLPDSAFAYIETGGKKDKDGKTVPRSLRHFPYKDKDGKPDAAHVRNALARIPQSKVSTSAKTSALKKINTAAKDLKIGSENKSMESNEEFKAGATHSKQTKAKLEEVQNHAKAMKDNVKEIAKHADDVYKCMDEMKSDDSYDEEAKSLINELEYILLEEELNREELYTTN